MTTPALSPGEQVIDLVTGDVGFIEYITYVPESRSLIGDTIPAHLRYSIRFPDGTYADGRTDDDLKSEHT